jgi:hypothetical protein
LTGADTLTVRSRSLIGDAGIWSIRDLIYYFVKHRIDLRFDVRIALLSLTLISAACMHSPSVKFAADPPQSCDLRDPFSLARVAPAIPRAPIATPEAGRTTIVGTIADAESGFAVRNATVLLTPMNAPNAQITVGRSDSTGAFVIRDLASDQYRREAVATFFTLIHDTVAIAGVVDTMRLVIHHGPAFCVRELNEVVFPKKPTAR